VNVDINKILSVNVDTNKILSVNVDINKLLSVNIIFLVWISEYYLFCTVYEDKLLLSFLCSLRGLVNVDINKKLSSLRNSVVDVVDNSMIYPRILSEEWFLEFDSHTNV
jgi:hypothetical protein